MTSRSNVRTSRKLSGVSYTLRGPLAAQAERAGGLRGRTYPR